MPYWLEVTLVIILFVGGFLFVVWKSEGSLKIIPDTIIGGFKRLYEILFLGIADKDAYEANKEQREKDEAYKKELKAKSKKKK